MASRDIYSVLAVPNFRWLWVGSLGSSFAMNMQIIARGWFVYDLTSSAMDLAWVARPSLGAQFRQPPALRCVAAFQGRIATQREPCISVPVQAGAMGTGSRPGRSMVSSQKMSR